MDQSFPPAISTAGLSPLPSSPSSSAALCSSLLSSSSSFYPPCSSLLESVYEFLDACRVGHPLAIAALGSAVFAVLVLVAGILLRHTSGSNKRIANKQAKGKRPATAAKGSGRCGERRESYTSERKLPAEDGEASVIGQEEKREEQKQKGGGGKPKGGGGGGAEKEGEEAQGWQVVIGRRRKGGGRPSM
eukprot:GHVS01046606.1.p1 GENE.GHVS01046606.1~~GHVS01046606.1.p1  ORF type:complete len:189 (+),score=66.77 GHVS01046606.1:132-698(+)